MRYTRLLGTMSLPTSRRLALLLLVLVACGHAQTDTSPWTAPANEIVEQLMAKAGSPTSVSLEVENRAAHLPADQALIRKALDEAFREAGAKIVRSDAAQADVRLILARNVSGLVWIAQVKQGPAEQVTILTFPDPGSSAPAPAALFRLERSLLLEREEPILDIAATNGHLVVLGSKQVAVYRREGGKAVASALLPSDRPWPRDLRGRIFTAGDAFTAYLPALRCEGTLRPNFNMRCAESDDPWPLLQPGANEPAAFYAAARNHFTGVLGGSLAGRTLPPFFTAARLGGSEGALWAVSGADGSTRLYTRLDQPLRTVPSLGSDIAALRSTCGTGWQLLVTGEGDGATPDMLQAFEIRNRDATAASEKMVINGAVKALWSAPDASCVIAVVHDPGKESYAAYSVTLACSR